MKIGYTLWTWLKDLMGDWDGYVAYGKRDFEQSLREISDLGYQCFENFNILARLYEDDPGEFEGLCQKYGLEFVNIYHYLQNEFEDDFAFGERCARFVERHGAAHLNMQAPWWPEAGTTQDDLDWVVEKLTIVGKMCREHGVQMCVHPHYGTTIFYEHEIDELLDRVKPEYLQLAIDTAHTHLADMDPVAAFDKYFDRIAYVHLKDWNPDHPAGEPMRGFSALGEGVVDVKGAVNVLKRRGYDGVLMVECDWPHICNYETAMVSRKYIHRLLGL